MTAVAVSNRKLYVMKWFVIAGVFLLFSCTSNQVETGEKQMNDTLVHSVADSLQNVPEEIPVAECLLDPNVDLVTCFKFFCEEKNEEIKMRPNDPECHEALWEAVKELETYVRGESKCYPYKKINSFISSMFLEQAYMHSHSGYENIEEYPGRTFALYFLEQVVRYCPKIEYLTEMHDAEGEVGILNYEEWCTYIPLYSFILYKAENGSIEVRSLGKMDEVLIKEFQQLEDKEGNKCFLLRNYNNKFAIYRYKDGSVKRLMCTWE